MSIKALLAFEWWEGVATAGFAMIFIKLVICVAEAIFFTYPKVVAAALSSSRFVACPQMHSRVHMLSTSRTNAQMLTHTRIHICTHATQLVIQELEMLAGRRLSLKSLSQVLMCICLILSLKSLSV